MPFAPIGTRGAEYLVASMSGAGTGEAMSAMAVLADARDAAL